MSKKITIALDMSPVKVRGLAEFRTSGGSAGAAVMVDARPKTIPSKRRSNDRARARTALRRGAWD